MQPTTHKETTLPKAIDVKHNKWSDVRVLFDDGHFSAIIGKYEGKADYDVATRWNGQGDDPGYPKLFKNPVWFNIPRYLGLSIVNSLMCELIKHTGAMPEEEFKLYKANLAFAEKVLKGQD